MMVPKKRTLVPIIIVHIKYSIIYKIFNNIFLFFKYVKDIGNRHNKIALISLPPLYKPINPSLLI